MPTEISLFAAFLIGLSGGLHCVGMCGGISAALGIAASRNNLAKQYLFALTYNIGRIISYSVVGLSAGLLISIIKPNSPLAHQVLGLVSSLLLILIGLGITGIIHRVNFVENAGARIWAFIQPLAVKLFPVNSFVRALALGLLWGWLPCGLVYSTLLLSATSASAFQSGLSMALFGLGTLPWLLLTTIMGQKLARLRYTTYIKIVLGSFLVILGGLSLYSTMSTDDSQGHENHHIHHH